MSDDAITASGGWCAPDTFAYNVDALRTNDFAFPQVSVARGGLEFKWHQPTPAEARAQEAMRAWTARTSARLGEARNAAVDAACVTALANGWDVHVYEPPTPCDMSRASEQDWIYLRSIGIEFTEGKHPVPTISYHQAPDFWDDDDDFYEEE